MLINTLTLDGVSFTDRAEDTTGGEQQCGIYTFEAPTSGDRSLDWSFTGAPSDGASFWVIALGADGTLSYIGAAADCASGSATASANASSNTGDFAVAIAAAVDAAPTPGGTGASNIEGSQSNNNVHAIPFTVTAGASSTTATSAGGGGAAEATVVLAIFRETGGGGGGDPVVAWLTA